MTASEWTGLGGAAAVAAVLEGEATAEGIAADFADAIAAQNPGIGAVRCFLRDEAMEAARDIDRRRRDGQTLGALAGLPVLVKENCDLTGAVCSAGLAFRRDHVARADSDIVRRLRAADAVILGLSVSDPGAFTTRTAEVTHPVDARLSVGGSSGGSGAALAAGLCLGAIGTDTGGSIRVPAACCGVFGLKPGYDALPLDGVFPLVPSLDHVGPMARDLADLALMWGALKGAAPPEAPLAASVGYDPAWIDECPAPDREALHQALRDLRARDIDCVKVELPSPDAVLDMHAQIFTMESWRWHSAHHPDDLDRYPEIARTWFGVAQTMPEADYARATQQRAAFTADIDAILGRVGAILTPTLPCDVPDKTAQVIDVAGKPVDFTMATVRHTCLFDHSGHPALAMPLEARQPSGLPVSVQLVAPKGREGALLKFAQAMGQG